MCSQYILRGIIFPFSCYLILTSEHWNTLSKRKALKNIWIEVEISVIFITKNKTSSHAFQWVRRCWKHIDAFESILYFRLYTVVCEGLEVPSSVTKTQGSDSWVHHDNTNNLCNWQSTFHPCQFAVEVFLILPCSRGPEVPWPFRPK